MSTSILVTGATGLLGNNVVRQLLDAGRSVRVLVRDGSDPKPIEGLDVEIVTGDIQDAASVESAIHGIDCVVHSAAFVQLGRSQLERHRAVNVEGTRHVARAARQAQARLIHVSSVDALGVRSVEEPADEDTAPTIAVPCSYVITKREAEQVVVQEVEQGLDAVIVNPGFMLGPWDWKPSSGRMLLEVARGMAVLAPRGHFSVGDARDAATGILAAIERGQTGRRYILGGTNLSYLDAWRMFADVTGARRPWGTAGPVLAWLGGRGGDLLTRITRREPDVNSGAIALARLPKCFTSQRAESDLGYRIRPLRDTVEAAWNWFREHGYA